MMEEKQWCRFCNVWYTPFTRHFCRLDDLRSHVVLLDNRASVAENAVDYLRELLAQAHPHSCDGLHHPKADQHGASDPCPILARIEAAMFPPSANAPADLDVTRKVRLMCGEPLRSAKPTGVETRECGGASTVDDVAHEAWAAAQLLPGEGIEDGVRRIVEVLEEHKDVCGNAAGYVERRV